MFQFLVIQSWNFDQQDFSDFPDMDERVAWFMQECESFTLY